MNVSRLTMWEEEIPKREEAKKRREAWIRRQNWIEFGVLMVAILVCGLAICAAVWLWRVLGH